jgi:hypothetical protein
MAGKIRTSWFIEILEKLGRSKKKGGMDLGDYRKDKSYRANSARKRRAENKRIDLDD